MELFVKIFAILIPVIGSLINILLLFIILRVKKLRERPSYQFILAISFVNLLYANVPLMFFVVSYWNECQS